MNKKEKEIKKIFNQWFSIAPSEKEQDTNNDIDYLLDNIKIDQKDNIVDFGCGDVRHLIALEKRNFKNLCGVDIAEKAIEKSRNNLQKTSNIRLLNQSFFKFLNEFQSDIDTALFFDFTITLYTDIEIYDIISSLKKKLSKNGKIFIESWNYDFLKKTNCMHYNRKYDIENGKFIDAAKCNFKDKKIVFERQFKVLGDDDFKKLKNQIQYLYTTLWWQNLAKKNNLKLRIVSKGNISQYIILQK